MTPKEKAIALIDKFSDLEDGEMYIEKSKQCALVVVDEILKSGCTFPSNNTYYNSLKTVIKLLYLQ